MIELYTKVGNTLLERDDPFFQFPDGQWHMDYSDFQGKEIAYITSTDANDYLKANLWNNCLSNAANLVVPYFPGARSDKGNPVSAAMYARLLPDYRKLVVFDVHSDYTLKYLKAVTSDEWGQNIVHVMPHEIIAPHLADEDYSGIIAPDKGSLDRADLVARRLNIPVFHATKERDPNTGKLLKFDTSQLPTTGKYLIVDDICDGGGTFLGLMKDWRNYGYTGEVHLYVSHGLFTKGLQDLSETFELIFTTDSIFDKDNYYRKWSNYGNLEVIPVKQHLLNQI